jgi:hypothetical protein
MALGVGRATALVVCACGIIGVAKLPPAAASLRRARLARMEQMRNAPELRLTREASRTARDLASAYEMLRFLQRRDSLANALGHVEGPLGVSAPNVPDTWKRWLADQTGQVAQATEARGAGGPVLAAMFVDTADRRTVTREQRRLHLWSNSTILAIDSAAGPFACLAIHDLRNLVVMERLRVYLGPERFREQTAFGFCRFVAAYGIPGPTIHAWLVDGGWRLGQSKGGVRRQVLLETSVVRSLMDDRQYELSACVQGSSSGCRSWMLHPALDRSGSLRLGTNAFLTSWWVASGFSGLLSDLENEIGAERFHRFWASSLPVDSAFASAFGLDLGTWTHDWLDRQFGPLPQQGPRPWDYAASVLVAGLLMAFGAAKAYGRNVRG